MDPMRVNLRATVLSCVCLFLGKEGCQSPPPWNVPPGLENGARVRVVSSRLGTAWQPGRVLLSSAGCWIVQATPTYDPKAITVLQPPDLTRLQLSKAVPPPDWWVVPEEEEGWAEMLPSDLEHASASRCGRS
jgi:hypothetical protein